MIAQHKTYICVCSLFIFQGLLAYLLVDEGSVSIANLASRKRVKQIIPVKLRS